MENNDNNKDTRERIKNLMKALIYITPFFLGWYGTYQLGEGNWIDCAYKSVQLYLMEYSVEASVLNAPTLIAKIAAPCVTAAFLISMLYSMVENLRIWVRLKTEDAVAFHGDSANIDQIQEKLGKRAIVSEKPMAFRARRHVLMFNEDIDMYHYIDQHGAKLLHDEAGEKSLFLCSEKILRGCYENSHIVVCNVAENCARSYWDNKPVLKKNEKILLIGFDNYAQRLLTQGILKNVLSDDSSIEYHVCGKFTVCSADPGTDEYASYLDTHLQLHKAVNVKKVSMTGESTDYRPRQEICENQDTVYFHEASWQKVLGRGSRFDRVIICKDMDAENMEILNELKTFYVVEKCHIKYTDKRILEALWDCEAEGISAFGVNEDLYDPEVILKEKLFLHAKMIHARYFAKHMCPGKTDNGEDCGNQVRVPLLDDETEEPVIDEKTGKVKEKVEAIHCLGNCAECPVLIKDWGQQNNFIRYSNVAQADHISEKLRILLGAEASIKDEHVGEKAVAAYEQLSDMEKEKLWKIEHIRWDRYHFMNNWDWAKERDKKNRKHHLLIPYDQLVYTEKEKDGDAYISLKELLG